MVAKTWWASTRRSSNTPKIWEASGHVAGFSDPLVEDKKTHKRYRLDHLLEAAGADVAGLTFEQMAAKMRELNLKSPDEKTNSPSRSSSI